MPKVGGGEKTEALSDLRPKTINVASNSVLNLALDTAQFLLFSVETPESRLHCPVVVFTICSLLYSLSLNAKLTSQI